MNHQRRIRFLLLLLIASSAPFQPKRVVAEDTEEDEEDGGGQYLDDDVDLDDLPDMLDSDDIAYFFDEDFDALWHLLTFIFDRGARNPDLEEVVHESVPELIIARGGGSTYTSEYKLRLDLEQARYLSTTLTEETEAQFFGMLAAPIYEKVLARIPPLDELQATHGLYAFTEEDYADGIDFIYNKAWRPLHLDAMEGSVLSESFDGKRVERQWFGEEGDTPGVVVVDDVLSAEAFARIRQIMLESTVWFQTKMPLTFGGYVGAYIDDGLHDKLLLQLAFELHQALPRIMEGNPLRYLWAYKYDSEYSGINLHADEAAVNVNLWLTPDDANLDPASGGLVVFTRKPPEDWDFEQYNTDTAAVVEQLLRPSNFANVTVPYRENRAVIFDSALFHQTDSFKFKKGYENRRINLTILYGSMKREEDPEGEEL